MKSLFTKPWVLVLWLVTAALYFVCRYTVGQPLEAITKLLPEIVLMVALYYNRAAIEKKVYMPVMFALLFSMIGDTAGEMKGGNIGQIAFVLQIFFFLIAQILYTVSFARNIQASAFTDVKKAVVKVLPLLVILVYLVVVGTKVFASIDSTVFIIACGVYLLALLGTGTTSVLQTRPHGWLFVLGAMFFIFSDSIIAIGAFVKPVPNSGLIIMSTYFIAQLLLNISLIGDSRS
ncbi:MAG: lysoplasmalogenase [Bacteroidales bacterium]|nr:lysoplasmalogenase [Bacteroidales bacterium]